MLYLCICKVGPTLNIKIADFGLSKKLDSTGTFKLDGNAMLPIRWLSPESLISGMFSVASDVWYVDLCFGICCSVAMQVIWCAFMGNNDLW